MKIIKDKSTVKSSGYTIATIGYFDGIHLGHKKIINEIVKQAKQKDGTSILITFWPHPRTVLEVNSEIDFLLSNSEKIKFLEEEGLDIIYLIEFTRDFSKIEAKEFVQNYLVEKLDIDKLVIGYNHNFGYRREGNYNFLEKNREKFEFDIQEIKKKEIDQNLNISSSNIRREILSGNIEQANLMLGYNFFISGSVIRGDGIGKKIGFPTANISIEDDEKILPGNGVYACKVEFEDTINSGMLNIGYRPTVDGKERRIEIHIFGINYDFYGKNLKIIIIKKIRDEIKFNSLDELKDQLKKDKIESNKVLNNEKVRN